MRDLVCDFLSAFVMLELVLLPLVGAFVVLPFVCYLVLEFMSVLMVLPLVRQLVLEFMSVLMVLPLVQRRFFFAQGLAGDTAENSAERAADRRADDRRGDSGDRAKNRRRQGDAPSDSSGDPPEELIRFKLVRQLVVLEFVSQLVVFPLQLTFMLLGLAETL